MKRLILFLLVALLPATAFAGTCENNLMGVGTPAAQATHICNNGGNQAITGTLAVTGASTLTGAVTATGGITSAAGDITLTAGTVIQTEVMVVPAWLGAQGATATVGWVSGDVGGVNKGLATLAASATADTLVIPITGLNIGDTVTAFKITGQLESGGNTATVDADLRKLTTAAAATADASIGAITQISKTADYKIADSKTLATPEVIATGETLYLLLTATTAASTDIELASVEVTVTKGN